MKKQHGFSLIEIIGVMAIVAILLSAAAPNIIKMIKNEQADAETTTLDVLGGALIDFISEKQNIPAPDSWTDSLAPYVDFASNDLSVAINGNRVMYVHPSFTFSNFPSQSYNQDSLFIADDDIPLTSAPTDARIIFASNIYQNITTASLTAAQFDAVWNQSGSIPADLVAGDSVSIERVNLSNLFFPVIFNVNSAPASWAVNTTSTSEDAAWPTSSQERYLLKNSKIYTRSTDGVDPIGDIYLVNQAITMGSTTSSGGSSSGSSSSSGIDCSTPPNWNGSTTFDAGDQAVHSNKLYTSTNNGNTGNPPNVSTWWWTEEGDCP